MRNGELDSKGALASIIKAEGTIQSFKVIFSFLLNKKSFSFETSAIIMNAHR